MKRKKEMTENLESAWIRLIKIRWIFQLHPLKFLRLIRKRNVSRTSQVKLFGTALKKNYILNINKKNFKKNINKISHEEELSVVIKKSHEACIKVEKLTKNGCLVWKQKRLAVDKKIVIGNRFSAKRWSQCSWSSSRK